jgi:hypothetical protein
MPWLSNEDMALKMKLQGLTVIDANNPARKVPVRYRLPEDELATLNYPIIIIEHQGLFPDPEREHSGRYLLPYAPEVLNPDGSSTLYPTWWPDNADEFNNNLSPYESWFPTPYNFDYLITVYCRKMPGHLDRLMSLLATSSRLPHHFGYLNIPTDGTQRKLWLMGGPQVEYGKDNNDKRLLRAIYRVRVESELILAESFTVNGPYGQPVTQIDIDLGCYSDVTDIATETVATNFGLLTVGPGSFWRVEDFAEPVGVYPEGSRQPLPIYRPRRPSRAHVQGTSYNKTLNKITPEE